MTVAASTTPDADPSLSSNPLLRAWTGPFEAPPFDAIRPEHYRPAFDEALAENRGEVAAIAGHRHAHVRQHGGGA